MTFSEQIKIINGTTVKLKWLFPFVIVLLIQTATAVWWASDLSTTLEYVEMNVKEIKITLDQKWEHRMEKWEASLEKLDDRLRAVETSSH